MSQESIEELKSILENQNLILEHQNDRIEHLIWQVVGNEKLEIEGLKPAVKRIEKDVHDIKKWRDGMWKIDLKRVLTKEVINTTSRVFIYAVVGGGGSFGMFELLKLIFDK